MMSRSMCGVETSFLGGFFVVIFFFISPIIYIDISYETAAREMARREKVRNG